MGLGQGEKRGTGLGRSFYRKKACSRATWCGKSFPFSRRNVKKTSNCRLHQKTLRDLRVSQTNCKTSCLNPYVPTGKSDGPQNGLPLRAKTQKEEEHGVMGRSSGGRVGKVNAKNSFKKSNRGREISKTQGEGLTDLSGRKRC